MKHLVIRTHSGKYIRETEANPDVADIKYWERYYSETDSKGASVDAVVVNIYETED